MNAVYAVPGLLQTEEYARAVFAIRRPLLDEDQIQRGSGGRPARQEIYRREAAPLMSTRRSVSLRPVTESCEHRPSHPLSHWHT
ncbi:Scr1 family TA system antitoxin-like transcriptional regulator [Streptomyces sp. NPDC004610]|uniref:Scr1 family TA system antitoxin-like transcriptional regulator n=1 Tax=unclassified Streptomyces TaxID=2593676 RepID=UPI0033A4F164